jgi:hypothetical protein
VFEGNSAFTRRIKCDAGSVHHQGTTCPDERSGRRVAELVRRKKEFDYYKDH